MNTEKQLWHLNKSVPIALILTILLQSGAAIWWASAQTQVQESLVTVTADHTLQLREHTAEIAGLDRESAVVLQQIRGLNTNMTILRNELRRTNDLLKQTLER